MNTEQERAEFEAFARNNNYDLDAVMLLSKPPKFSHYASPSTQDAWEAYQAGRAALQSQPIESAAREIALWAYGEVGADPELTPGLAQLLHHFGISDDVPVALQSQDRMKDQLNLVISKADKARAERTTEVVTCITKARKDEVRDRSGFATEMADQYGFAFIDDDAEYMVCNTESLTDLMSVLGFRTSEERHNVTIPANTALTDEEIQTLWMNVATFDAHLADVLAISRAVERAAIEADCKRRGEPVAYMFADEWGRTKIVLGKETAEHWCPPDENITPLYTTPQPAEPVKVSDDLAHEIWAAAQTAPGEGIEGAVERVAALQSQDREDAERWREIARRYDRGRLSSKMQFLQAIRINSSVASYSLASIIDHARRIEGDRE